MSMARPGNDAGGGKATQKATCLRAPDGGAVERLLEQHAAQGTAGSFEGLHQRNAADQESAENAGQLGYLIFSPDFTHQRQSHFDAVEVSCEAGRRDQRNSAADGRKQGRDPNQT